MNRVATRTSTASGQTPAGVSPVLALGPNYAMVMSDGNWFLKGWR